MNFKGHQHSVHSIQVIGCITHHVFLLTFHCWDVLQFIHFPVDEHLGPL